MCASWAFRAASASEHTDTAEKDLVHSMVIPMAGDPVISTVLTVTTLNRTDERRSGVSA